MPAPARDVAASARAGADYFERQLSDSAAARRKAAAARAGLAGSQASALASLPEAFRDYRDSGDFAAPARHYYDAAFFAGD